MVHIWSRPLCTFHGSSTELAEFHPDFSDAFCETHNIDFAGHILANLVWAAILTLRVRALWLRKKALVWVIYACYVGSMGTFVVLAVLANVQLLSEYLLVNPYQRIDMSIVRNNALCPISTYMLAHGPTADHETGSPCTNHLRTFPHRFDGHQGAGVHGHSLVIPLTIVSGPAAGWSGIFHYIGIEYRLNRERDILVQRFKPPVNSPPQPV